MLLFLFELSSNVLLRLIFEQMKCVLDMRHVLQIARGSAVSFCMASLLQVYWEAVVEVRQKNCRVECSLEPKVARKLITVD